METIAFYLNPVRNGSAHFAQFQYNFIVAKHEHPYYGGKNHNRQSILSKLKPVLKLSSAGG